MPAIASEHGEGAAYIGILLSAIALGGIAANPLVRRLNDREEPALIMLGVSVILSWTFTGLWDDPLWKAALFNLVPGDVGNLPLRPGV